MAALGWSFGGAVGTAAGPRGSSSDEDDERAELCRAELRRRHRALLCSALRFLPSQAIPF